MPLITLTEDRIRRELERCAATERAARAEQRRLQAFFVAVAFGPLLQALFWALSFHLVGDAATAAKWSAVLCAPAPTLLVLIRQRRRGE